MGPGCTAANGNDNNFDRIPNGCQCGDFNVDGLLGFDDAQCAVNCFLGGGVAALPCVCPTPVADTQNDGLFGFDDATNALNAFLSGINFTMTCSARPGTVPGVLDGVPPPPLIP